MAGAILKHTKILPKGEVTTGYALIFVRKRILTHLLVWAMPLTSWSGGLSDSGFFDTPDAFCC
jgi:hypothetical protein